MRHPGALLSGVQSLPLVFRGIGAHIPMCVCDECVDVCDTAFSQGQDYFPQNLSVMYSCHTLSFWRAESPSFYVSLRPKQGCMLLTQHPSAGELCSQCCGKHILSAMILVLADFMVSQSSPGIMEGRALGALSGPKSCAGHRASVEHSGLKVHLPTHPCTVLRDPVLHANSPGAGGGDKTPAPIPHTRVWESG